MFDYDWRLSVADNAERARHLHRHRAAARRDRHRRAQRRRPDQPRTYSSSADGGAERIGLITTGRLTLAGSGAGLPSCCSKADLAWAISWSAG